MQSYQTFMPGSHSNSIRILKYVTEYNNKFNENKKCSSTCILQQINKKALGTGSGSSGFSSKMKQSNFILNNKGGTIQYGQQYLNKPVSINYLGRAEGMPGGSGNPPRNIFN